MDDIKTVSRPENERHPVVGAEITGVIVGRLYCRVNSLVNTVFASTNKFTIEQLQVQIIVLMAIFIAALRMGQAGAISWTSYEAGSK